MNKISATDLVTLLKKQRFVLSNEKSVQADIESVLMREKIEHIREVALDKNSIIDFMVGEIGVEVKIKGVKASIYKQLDRYAKIDSIKELILITSTSIGIPSTLNGKSVYVVNMSKAWL